MASEKQLTQAELDAIDEIAESIIPGFKRTPPAPSPKDPVVDSVVDEIMKFM